MKEKIKIAVLDKEIYDKESLKFINNSIEVKDNI